MKTIIKKSFLLGIGAVSLTRKKAEKVVKAAVKKGAITASEGNKLIGSMVRLANTYRKKLEKAGEAEVKKQLRTLGFKSLTEAKKLKKKARALEKILRSKAKKVAIAALKRI